MKGSGFLVLILKRKNKTGSVFPLISLISSLSSSTVLKTDLQCMRTDARKINLLILKKGQLLNDSNLKLHIVIQQGKLWLWANININMNFFHTMLSYLNHVKWQHPSQISKYPFFNFSIAPVNKTTTVLSCIQFRAVKFAIVN